MMHIWGLILLLATAEQATVPEVPLAPETRQPVEVTTHVDKGDVTVGDPIRYSVKIEYAPDVEIHMPADGDSMGGLSVSDRSQSQRVLASGRRVEEREFVLRADKAGSFALPSVAVAYALKKPSGPSENEQKREPGETTNDAEAATPEAEKFAGTEVFPIAGSVSSEPIYINVRSVLPNNAEDIRGLKPLHGSGRSVPIWIWVLLGAAIVAAGIFAALWFKRRKRAIAAEPPALPHEEALKALERIERQPHEDPAARRAAMFSLSWIVRGYVEGQFGLNASDMTTAEIAARLPSILGLVQEDRKTLLLFLEGADRIKYTGAEASVDEVRKACRVARELIEHTMPRPVVAEIPANEAPPHGEKSA